MTSFMGFVVTVLSTAGVASVLLMGVAWLLRAWISERLSAQIRHQYDRQLAELNAELRRKSESAAAQLKADLDRLGDRLRISAQSLGEVQKATIERRLFAVEELWSAVLDAEAALPAFFGVLDVLFDNEYLSALTKPRTAAQIRAIDYQIILGPALERGRGVALRRPFIGSFLWALFSTYRAVLFRMIYLVSESNRQPEKIYWYSDQLIRKHIRAALGESALADFDLLSTGRISWMREHFTLAILSATESVIAGNEASEAALRQAERMEKLLISTQLTS